MSGPLDQSRPIDAGVGGQQHPIAGDGKNDLAERPVAVLRGIDEWQTESWPFWR